MIRPFRVLAACTALAASTGAYAAPDHVDITWMSIANMHFAVGDQRIVADGYITRLPQDLFHSGATGLAATHRAALPDAAAVREVFEAIGGKPAVKLLLTGHSHFDHSFDTPTWAKLSGARIVGSPTTCLQSRAAGLAARRCKPVYGGEKISLARGVDMYVIRWNHSGDPAKNAEQHNAVELHAPPVPDSTGGFRAGVAEDFPNGGGNRAYLFTVDGPEGRFSWLFQDSASAIDLRERIVVDGKDYGAPLDNLRAAMEAAGISRVDLWIATGGREVAELVLPVVKPKAYLPVHWDGLFGAFKAGPPQPYADAALEPMLAEHGVQRIVPLRYMDKWRLDAQGIRAIDNSAVKRKLGFN
jgi:hypothetical protein